MKEVLYYAALVSNGDYYRCLRGAVYGSYFRRPVGPFARESEAVDASKVAFRDRGDLDHIAVVEVCGGEFVRAVFQ